MPSQDKNVTEHLQLLISKALNEIDGVAGFPVHLEHPSDSANGDYSTNIAMTSFAAAKKADPNFQFQTPRLWAEHIVSTILKIKNQQNDEIISEVKVAGSGFINLTLSSSFLLNSLKRINEQKTQDIHNFQKGKKIIVEFTDPNPFKEFHIGHLYSNSVGETICRLLATTGAQVKRVCYQGDVGMHVAKSIWGIRQKLQQEKITLQHISERSTSERVKFLGQAYALGATAYEQDQNAQKEIKAMNFMCFRSAQDQLVEREGWVPQINYAQFLQDVEISYQEVKEIYNTGRRWSLEYFETMYHRLGMKFDDYYFESLTAEFGVKIVQEYLQKGVFKESQDAVIFPGSEYGLHDRVFINSLGLPTYECKELGLAPEKYHRFPYDESIIITGKEIDEYFKVLIIALKEIYPDLGNKTRHFSHGMVRLPEGKMSSRTGKVLTAEWLMDEAKQRVMNIFTENGTQLSEDEIDATAEKIGMAAIKYALLKSNLGADISFSFNESLSFQGNSGPYLQYTYARCRSVLAKAGEYFPDLATAEFEREELEVMRQLYQFSEVVEKAAREFAPHRLCTYLFNLAQAYNALYNAHSILGDTVEPVKRLLRLELTAATARIIQQGLDLLGIQTVEKM